MNPTLPWPGHQMIVCLAQRSGQWGLASFLSKASGNHSCLQWPPNYVINNFLLRKWNFAGRVELGNKLVFPNHDPSFPLRALRRGEACPFGRTFSCLLQPQLSPGRTSDLLLQPWVSFASCLRVTALHLRAAEAPFTWQTQPGFWIKSFFLEWPDNNQRDPIHPTSKRNKNLSVNTYWARADGQKPRLDPDLSWLRVSFERNQVIDGYYKLLQPFI